jgi:hypothetical protein
VTALHQTAMTMSTASGELERRCDFEGLHYVRVGQARAREAALCMSPLPPSTRLLLLILAEVQINGCCPMGPEVWQPALGLAEAEAADEIAALVAVGFLSGDSDLHCLHVHGRAANKRAGRRRSCGKDAQVGRSDKKARPRRKGYAPLIQSGRAFKPPCTRLAA